MRWYFRPNTPVNWGPVRYYILWTWWLLGPECLTVSADFAWLRQKRNKCHQVHVPTKTWLVFKGHLWNIQVNREKKCICMLLIQTMAGCLKVSHRGKTAEVVLHGWVHSALPALKPPVNPSIRFCLMHAYPTPPLCFLHTGVCVCQHVCGGITLLTAVQAKTACF